MAIDNPFSFKAPTLKAILVCASKVSCIRKIQMMALKENMQLVAIDGGYDTVIKTGIRPVLSIGDFDSTNYDVDEIRYNSENIIELNVDKDKTDFEEALEEVFYRGFTNLSIFGILGGNRIDFELNNLLVLSKYASKDRKIDVYSQDGLQSMSLITESQLNIADIKDIDLNKLISIIPITDCEVDIQGMKYNYTGSIQKDSSFTMSNKGSKDGIINIKKGIAYIGYSLINL